MSAANPATIEDLGEVIWEASRHDESTISFTGANIVARAILAKFDVEHHDREAENEARYAIHDLLWAQRKNVSTGHLFWEDAQMFGNALWAAGYRKVELAA